MHSWELLPNALAGGSGLHQVRRLSVQRARAQDTTLMRLLARDELMTLGADERDIDWRSAWLAELAKDDKPTDRQKGARAPQLWCDMQQRGLPGTVRELLSAQKAAGRAKSSQHQRCFGPARFR